MKISVPTLIGIIIIAATLIGLFVSVSVGSQCFKLPFAEWFDYWGTAIEPTGINITPGIIVVR